MLLRITPVLEGNHGEGSAALAAIDHCAHAGPRAVMPGIECVERPPSVNSGLPAGLPKACKMNSPSVHRTPFPVYNATASGRSALV